MNKIVILGGGKLGCAITRGLINTNPDFIMYVVSRDPLKVKKHFLEHDHVIAMSYDAPIEKGLPCIVTVSCDEHKVITKLLASGVKNVSRLSVAQYNLEIIKSIEHYLKDLDSNAYFILTNPIENIMESLTNILPEEKIFGLGLDLDARRMQSAIKMLFGVSIENLICTGAHSAPVPLLEEVIKSNLCKVTYGEVLSNLTKQNDYEFNVSGINIYDEFKKVYIGLAKNKSTVIISKSIYWIIEELTKILVRSEFNLGKPPVEHPAVSVVHVITSFIQKKQVNVCYFDKGKVVGGLIQILT